MKELGEGDSAIESHRRCWRLGQEAVDELRNSKLRPTNIYAVIVAAFLVFSLIAVFELITGQIIHRYWASLWYYSIFSNTPPFLWYFLVNFIFDILLLVLSVLLPIFGILVHNKCAYSATKTRNCFLTLTTPVVFLWSLLMFLLTPSALLAGGSDVPLLWRQVVSTSIIAQYIGILTTSYGLLWALRHISEERMKSLKDRK